MKLYWSGLGVAIDIHCNQKIYGYQKEGNYIMSTIYLSSRKRETVSYLQYAYHLDFVHQKEGNCIILTVCL